MTTRAGWREWLAGLRAVLYKEFIHLRRDPATLRIAVLIPLMQMFLFGYAVDMNVEDVPTVVYDLDQRRASRDLVRMFENTSYFRVVGEVDSEAALTQALVSGRARVGLRIPPDFSASLTAGRPVQVQVLIDGSDSTVANQALNVSTSLGLTEALRRALAATGAEAPLLEIRPRLLFNPDARSTHFIVPGLVGIILQNTTVLLTALAIVRERERGTLEQVLVTPVRPLALMLGKLVPYAVLGFVETLGGLAVMRWVFDVPIAGSVVLLLVVAWIFLVCALGLGLLISNVSDNQAQAIQLAFLVILPSILLSGYVFPRETIPPALAWTSYLIPVTYFIEVLRGVILRGAGVAELWPQAAALLVFGAALIGLSASRFRKRLD
ncbi:MAG TPA: ABC transporter permease [Thermodesulfobacteriota bacterium]